MASPRIALATCARLPEPDPDHEPLIEALERAGLAPFALPWDDPAAAADGAKLCLLRSTWNYPEAPGAFLDWLETVSRRCTVLNPPELVRWNIHKGYLAQLAAAGVAVAPTMWVRKGERADLARAARQRGWDEVVVKPAVSAASFRTQRFGRGAMAAAQRFLDGLTRERDAMVQQYLPSVETGSERSLIWIAGQLTHAVGKTPRFAGEDERVSDEAVSIEADERALAENVIAAAQVAAPAMGEALYARVDIMRDNAGGAVLSELELIEPSLYFPQCPAALTRFVAAIVRRLDRMRASADV